VTLPECPDGRIVARRRARSVSRDRLGERARIRLSARTSAVLRQPHPLQSRQQAVGSIVCTDALARQFVDNPLRFLDGAPLCHVVDKRLGYVPSTSAEGPP
jgi:hypothetical protein